MLVAQQLFDLSGDLTGLADRDEEFKLPAGRGDEFATDRREVRIRGTSRNYCSPLATFSRQNLHIDTLKIKAGTSIDFPHLSAVAPRGVISPLAAILKQNKA
nr:hypothetical protein [Agrobacterium tumefaciens]